MQRYEVWSDSYEGLTVEPDDRGEWVRWEDVKAAFPAYAALMEEAEDQKSGALAEISRLQKQAKTNAEAVVKLQKELDLLRKTQYAVKYRAE